MTLNELTSDDVKSILLMLNISVSSKGANYLIASIILCYYCPFLLENLENDVYKRVADYYDTTKDKVRENIRNALLNVDNSYIDKFSSPLFKLLDYKDNITPKKFIEIMATYFRNRNKK